MFAFEEKTRTLLAAVAAAGSVSGAARALGLDPANALRHLRTAESRTGVALVARARGGAARGHAALTVAGRALVATRASRAALGTAAAFDAARGVTVVTVRGRPWAVAGRVPEGAATLACRDEDVAVARAPERGAPAARSSVQNAAPARVARLIDLGDGTFRVTFGARAFPQAARITRGAVRALRLRAGSAVVVSVKATALKARPLTGRKEERGALEET